MITEFKISGEMYPVANNASDQHCLREALVDIGADYCVVTDDHTQDRVSLSFIGIMTFDGEPGEEVYEDLKSAVEGHLGHPTNLWLCLTPIDEDPLYSWGDPYEGNGG